ncbi:TetR/AcrR family transcriptional regulator [Pseudomonas aeruginosa]
MSKSPRARAETTRREILEAASILFRQHGVDGVSLSRVMAEIAMTPGGFYKYFSSKEALACEVCVNAIRQSQESWQAIFERAPRLSEPPLRYLASQYFPTAAEGQCPVVTLGQDAADLSHDKSFRQVYSEGSKALLDKLLSLAKEQSPTVSRKHTLVQFAAMVGIGFLSRATGTEQWVKEMEDALLAQLK